MDKPLTKNLGLAVVGYFVIIFALLYLVNILVGVVPNFVMRYFGASENFRVFLGSTFGYSVRIIASIFLTSWVIRRVLKLDPKKLMYPVFPGWWKDILFGIGLVFIITLSIFAFEVAAGWLEVEGWAWKELPFDVLARNLWLSLLINLSVAISEETLFRGYFLTGLIRAWGIVLGFITMAVVFAAVHLFVIGAEETSALLFIPLLSIPGFVLGWIFLQARSLWLPISIHFAWNLLQDEVYNLHGRGTAQHFGAMTNQTGPSWMVGTNYGIEVAVLGVIAWILVVLGVWLWAKYRRYDSIDGLTDEFMDSD